MRDAHWVRVLGTGRTGGRIGSGSGRAWHRRLASPNPRSTRRAPARAREGGAGSPQRVGDPRLLRMGPTILAVSDSMNENA